MKRSGPIASKHRSAKQEPKRVPMKIGILDKIRKAQSVKILDDLVAEFATYELASQATTRKVRRLAILRRADLSKKSKGDKSPAISDNPK